MGPINGDRFEAYVAQLPDLMVASAATKEKEAAIKLPNSVFQSNIVARYSLVNF